MAVSFKVKKSAPIEITELLKRASKLVSKKTWNKFKCLPENYHRSTFEPPETETTGSVVWRGDVDKKKFIGFEEMDKSVNCIIFIHPFEVENLSPLRIYWNADDDLREFAEFLYDARNGLDISVSWSTRYRNAHYIEVSVKIDKKYLKNISEDYF